MMSDAVATASSIETPPPSASRSRLLLRVFAQGMLVSFALGVISAGLPPTWKRLGVMYAVQGALFGAAFAWIARREGARRPQRLYAMLAMQTTLSLFNTSLISARQYRAAVEARYAQKPETQAILNLLRQSAQTDPDAARQVRDLERQISPTFSDYLRFRYSNVVKSAGPVPELLWGGEVLFGIFAAVAACSHTSRRLRSEPTVSAAGPTESETL
jgi:hypothetical protein